MLESLKNEERTMIFYEAPHKLMATLRDMYKYFGERRICLCREITKIHEEFRRTTLSDAIAHYEENPPRGEFVLVIEGKNKEEILEEAAKQCDLMLTPVTPTVAFHFNEKSDPLQMYLSDIFTIALNLSGNCGISVPAGKDPVTGMPVGIQFLAPALAESKLLAAATAFEKATAF